jgi:SAM-dependent methyltransferase
MYSNEWYDIFLDSVPAVSTRSEAAFVERYLPSHAFPLLLDLCCGPGRHAAMLAPRGYRILGLDANEGAVRRARAACAQGKFVVGDMRSLPALRETFDGAINLWHSFGYYDDATNQMIVRQVHDVLRPGGRAVFDIYNRQHFALRPREETTERNGRQIHTTRNWEGNRHRVTLAYDGRVGDVFEWRLYTPHEFEALCAAAGLRTLLACAWFDASLLPAAEHARMQFVVERS